MISIIIPVFNQHDMTQDCIDAIRECTQDCEIIIIDNGSTPPIKVPFTGDIQTRVIRNEENKGFPVAVNQGIREAAGDVIILLNNDVIVTPGWAERLAAHLEIFSIVGPLTNFCAGLQRAQIADYQSKAELYKEASALAEECAGEFEEVNFVIGFCMAFKRSLFDEIGPFDESLWPCSGEEIDFCLKARPAGHRIGIAHDVYVHHEGSRTFGDMEKAGDLNYQEICKRNDAHLAEKWGADFWKRQAIDNEPKTEAVTIGAYSYVDGDIDVSFTEDATLTIGKFCSIAARCRVILGGNHRGDWLSTFPFPGMFPDSPDIPDYRTSKGDVTIGNDVWIGHGVTILSGVTIGDGAIIGAESVVVKDVEPYTLVAGNPAGYMKDRFSREVTQRLLEIKWWDWTDDKIRGAIPLLMSGDYDGLEEYAAGVKA
jgi:acetyltransferase-like isoleucine patch superfamily enzyme